MTVDHFLLGVLESGYRLRALFLHREQKMARKSPHKELLRVQGLNIFPKGHNKMGKKSKLLFVLVVTCNKKWLLGSWIRANGSASQLLATSTSFLHWHWDQWRRQTYCLCHLHLQNLRPGSPGESAEGDLLCSLFHPWWCVHGWGTSGERHYFSPGPLRSRCEDGIKRENFIKGNICVRGNGRGWEGWEGHQTRWRRDPRKGGRGEGWVGAPWLPHSPRKLWQGFYPRSMSPGKGPPRSHPSGRRHGRGATWCLGDAGSAQMPETGFREPPLGLSVSSAAAGHFWRSLYCCRKTVRAEK